MDLTFDQFKTLLLPLFVNSHYFDDDKLMEVYRDYDELRHLPAFDTVKKFAEWYLYIKSVAIDCRTFRIPINFQNCTVVKIKH